MSTHIDTTKKKNIVRGMLVDIVAEKDSMTQILTRGYVLQILSKADNAKGIRVQLTNGVVGHVKDIPSQEDIRLENFKFYNRFFHLPMIYSIWDSAERKYLVVDHKNTIKQVVEKTAFLFDSIETAKAFVRGTEYEQRRYVINPINRKKPIHENFKTLQVSVVRINGERKLSLERLIEWERKFTNMC